MPATDGWGYDSQTGKWVGGGKSYGSVDDYRVAAKAEYDRTGVRPGQICRGGSCGGTNNTAANTNTQGVSGATGSASGGISGGILSGSGGAGGLASSQNVDKNGVGQYGPDLVENRITNMLGNDSDYLNMFRSNAQRAANQRGLLNSSMAATGGERAAYEGAFNIASQDSNAANQFILNEQAFDYNSALQNATEANKFGLLANENTYTQDQMRLQTDLEMQMNERLHQFDVNLRNMDIDAEDRANLMNHYDQLTQQYMMQRSAILTDPNLDESSKNKMIADLDQVYGDSVNMQSQLANYDVAMFSGGVDATSFSSYSNLSEDQQQALSGVNSQVLSVLDPNTELNENTIAALQNVDSQYIDFLDTSKTYTADQLALLSGVEPVYADFLNDDMVYSPEEIGQNMSGVNASFANFLKPNKVYTPEEIGQLQGVDPGTLKYIKQPANGANYYTPEQLGKLSGIDATVLQGQSLYGRTPGEVLELYNSLSSGQKNFTWNGVEFNI